MKVLCRQTVQEIKPLFWQGRKLYTSFQSIKAHLVLHLGNEFQYFLAEGIEQDKGLKSESVKWGVPYSNNYNYTIFNSLNESDKEVAEINLQSKVKKINQHILSLASSKNKDDKEWLELLSKIVLCTKVENTFFSEDLEPTVTCWAGVANLQGISQGIVGRHIRSEIKNPKIKPKEEEVIDESLTMQDKEHQFIGEDKVVQENNNTQEEAESNNVSSNDNLYEIEQKADTNNEDFENQKNNITQDNGSDIPPNDNNTKRKWRKNWWWLLLLLPLLFLLFKYCNKPKDVTILPSQPGIIVPIDSNKIVPSPDSVKTIVSNRINVVLKGKNQDINAFANSFKRAYPNNDYQIIYYDTLTKRIQLQVPDSLRESTMKEIPQKLPDFEMLIWHESLFQRNVIPNDQGFQDNEKSWYFDDIEAPSAWDKVQGDSKIIVAAIDDGFDLSHSELKKNIVKPYNVCYRSTNVFSNQKAMHGTHVASTAIGKNNNGSGVCGIAPNCTFMPIQVGDNNGLISSTAIIDAVLYAIQQGANVVNMSLGLMVDPMVSKLPINVQRDIIRLSYKDEEEFWNQIFELADSKNITFVLAGGNQNVMIGLDPMQRSPSTIKVSATNVRRHKAEFSNYGDFSTISAPGEHIFNAVPNEQYKYYDGTSMASPIVAGAVALIKSVKPELKNSQIIETLQRTGIPISGGQKVGNLIQLDKAIQAIQNGLPPSNNDCSDITAKIDSLQQEIERLKRQCPDANSTQDTLKMPENPVDFKFGVGRWKSTEYLQSTNGSNITLYFDFYDNGSGKITLVEPDGKTCSASLKLALQNNMLIVDQTDPALCNPSGGYDPYYFECKAGNNGLAICYGQNKKYRMNNFTFNLIKVK